MHEDEEKTLDIVDGPCLIPQGRRERGQRSSLPPLFPGAKYFFPRKIGKHKIFTSEEHMRLECIY